MINHTSHQSLWFSIFELPPTIRMKGPCQAPGVGRDGVPRSHFQVQLEVRWGTVQGTGPRSCCMATSVAPMVPAVPVGAGYAQLWYPALGGRPWHVRPIPRNINRSFAGKHWSGLSYEQTLRWRGLCCRVQPPSTQPQPVEPSRVCLRIEGTCWEFLGVKSRNVMIDVFPRFACLFRVILYDHRSLFSMFLYILMVSCHGRHGPKFNWQLSIYVFTHHLSCVSKNVYLVILLILPGILWELLSDSWYVNLNKIEPTGDDANGSAWCRSHVVSWYILLRVLATSKTGTFFDGVTL